MARPQIPVSYRIFPIPVLFFFEVKKIIELEVVSKSFIWIRNDWQPTPCGIPDKRRVYPELAEGFILSSQKGSDRE